MDASKYPDILLFNKLERIICHDFDHIYINLLQLVRPNHRAQYLLKYAPQHSLPASGHASPLIPRTTGVPSDIEELEEDIES